MDSTSRIQKLLDLMGRQLGLCCHRAVGNLPMPARRKNEGRLA
jgi:hypothetical protein